MNSKVVKETKKSLFNKESLIKLGLKILNWITRGSVDKNTVLAVTGVVIASATNFGPTAIRPEVEAVQQGLEQIQSAFTYDVDTTIVGSDTIITPYFY